MAMRLKILLVQSQGPWCGGDSGGIGGRICDTGEYQADGRTLAGVGGEVGARRPCERLPPAAARLQTSHLRLLGQAPAPTVISIAIALLPGMPCSSEASFMELWREELYQWWSCVCPCSVSTWTFSKGSHGQNFKTVDSANLLWTWVINVFEPFYCISNFPNKR